MSTNIHNMREMGNLSNGRITADAKPTRLKSLWISVQEDQLSGLHNFTPTLLNELQSVIQTLKSTNGSWQQDGKSVDIHYTVIRSANSEYFSVGGDLKYFRECIDSKNADSLRDYSMKCLSLLLAWRGLLKNQLTSISLVQGRALGGGFEMALSSDFLIAEEHSSFGFPEIMFGLFPCTGAMGLLSARVGVHQAEKLMTSKKIYSARELFEMGVVDQICETGTGQFTAEQFIAEHATRQKARLAIQQSRHRLSPLDHTECVQIVEDWVDIAMQLTDAERRSLEMLILMQNGTRSFAQGMKAA